MSERDRGLFGTFNYDRDYLQPEPEREECEERDLDEWVFRDGRWVFIGD